MLSSPLRSASVTRPSRRIRGIGRCSNLLLGGAAAADETSRRSGSRQCRASRSMRNRWFLWWWVTAGYTITGPSPSAYRCRSSSSGVIVSQQVGLEAVRYDAHACRVDAERLDHRPRTYSLGTVTMRALCTDVPIMARQIRPLGSLKYSGTFGTAGRGWSARTGEWPTSARCHHRGGEGRRTTPVPRNQDVSPAILRSTATLRRTGPRP